MTRAKKIGWATAVGTAGAMGATFVFPVFGLGWLAITWATAGGAGLTGAAAGLASSTLALSLPGDEAVVKEMEKDKEGAAVVEKIDKLAEEVERALNDNKRLQKENEELRRKA